MTTTGERPARPSGSRRRSLATGLLAGLAAGGVLWVAYFVQASTIDVVAWEVVVPTFAAVVCASLLTALLRAPIRRGALGFALGTALTVAVVLVAIVGVFSVLGLE